MANRNVDLTSQDWRNLVFADKNKEFGAYQLRKESDKRHNLAAIFTLIGLVCDLHPYNRAQQMVGLSC